MRGSTVSASWLATRPIYVVGTALANRPCHRVRAPQRKPQRIAAMGQTTVFPEEPQGARNDDAYVAGSMAAALNQGSAFGELNLLLALKWTKCMAQRSSSERQFRDWTSDERGTRCSSPMPESSPPNLRRDDSSTSSVPSATMSVAHCDCRH